MAGALGMIKKRIDKHIYKILASFNLNERQKLRFAELLIFFVEFYQCD